MHTKEEILATLRATPELLRLATAPIDEDFARRRPAPSRWSIVEIVAHLNDVDENVNQIRVTLMLREDMPILERYDHEAECLRKKFIERKLSSELPLCRYPSTEHLIFGRKSRLANGSARVCTQSMARSPCRICLMSGHYMTSAICDRFSKFVELDCGRS